MRMKLKFKKSNNGNSVWHQSNLNQWPYTNEINDFRQGHLPNELLSRKHLFVICI